ncbi:lipid-transfer protein [Microbacterium aoyamense]|uniref:propanoyl-CoA C-acyltransferase n=1 Tax=Microbacterium aoyamense TaxID=344166 RepID=A0ABN2PXB6_9MICO|nr:lipid-transfer protein [Microbacterium aoyamense]
MNVVVAGVGLVPFRTPRHSETYDVMAEQAVRGALADADLEIGDVDQAFAGYVYADSAAGQTALHGVGATGIPVVNVNNYCASGSTALWLGRQAILSGTARCVLVVGFEQMAPGAIGSVFPDRPESLWRFAEARDRGREPSDAPAAAQYFGAAGQAYLDRYDVDVALFAEVAVKARRHAAANPVAVFRDPVTVDEVLASPHVYGPLTRLQCCPPTCGAAAAVLCTPEFARAHGLDPSIVIRAQAMTSDRSDTFEGDAMKLVGSGIARQAADAVYEASGVDPFDIPVVELHDCFTANEIISYEALRLTPEGTSDRFVRSGDNTYGGRIVTNPSGGLLSKGHPLGATGLAQCAELVWQLRGTAGERQVAGARLALQHNLGLGSACVVTLYERLGVAA